jgi:hypothetical protein
VIASRLFARNLRVNVPLDKKNAKTAAQDMALAPTLMPLALKYKSAAQLMAFAKPLAHVMSASSAPIAR